MNDHRETELIGLIEALHEAERRLEELTGGQVDAVSSQAGHTYVLRRAQEGLRLAEAEKQAAILDALPAHIALVDARGLIVSTNESWRSFPQTAISHAPGGGLGSNYLDQCASAQGAQAAEAQQVAEGIRLVLAGQLKSFWLEYPCHSHDERRYLRLTVTPLPGTPPRGAVAMHVNVTSEKQAAEKVLTGELRFRQMAENIRDVFFLRDADGRRMLYVSPAYEQIWGRTCESLYQNPESWIEAIHPEDQAESAAAVRSGLLSGDFHIEYRIVRPDGAVRWIESRGFPVEDNGRLVRIAGIAGDITERKLAEAKIVHLSRVHAMLSGINTLIVRARDRDELFAEACRVAVEAGGFRMALVAVTDPVGSALRAVASAGSDEGLMAEVTHLLSDPEMAAKTMIAEAMRTQTDIISNDSRNDARVLLQARYTESSVRSIVVLPLMVSEEAVGVLALYSHELDFFHGEEMKLLRELSGDIAFCISTIHARAERKVADEALRSSLKEKEALLKEVHHRVKNNMQVITSLLRLESNRIDHVTTKSVLRDMQNRIHAMVALHESVYRSNNFAQVDLAAYLKHLTNQLSRSLVEDPSQISFHLDLTSVGLGLDQAIPCGLIVNELVSNALKHAFPSGRSGEVRIVLARNGDKGLRLQVIDNGVGLPGEFESIRTRSLGLQLVSDLAQQLGGELRIGPGPGALFELTFEPAPSQGDERLLLGA